MRQRFDLDCRSPSPNEALLGHFLGQQRDTEGFSNLSKSEQPALQSCSSPWLCVAGHLILVFLIFLLVCLGLSASLSKGTGSRVYLFCDFSSC